MAEQQTPNVLILFGDGLGLPSLSCWFRCIVRPPGTRV